MDDWEKKYWSLKQQQKQNSLYTQMPPKNPSELPHYGPAHVNNNIKNYSQQQNRGWKEIDPLTAMYSNMERIQSNTQQETVLLRPGAKYYKSVQADSFGSTMPLVKNCGAYSENIQREFVMKSSCRCYIIDELSVVDMGNPDPKRLVELVTLQAPFVGTILVESNSVIRPGNNKGPQILKG